MAQQRGAVRSPRRAAGQLRMCEHLRGARTRGGWVGREGVNLVKQEARDPKEREGWFLRDAALSFPGFCSFRGFESNLSLTARKHQSGLIRKSGIQE
jgi:hypothetical protein